MANEFLVSVADVIGRDKTTGNVLFHGKANIGSSFNMTMQATDVRGGINNPLLFTYYHDREISVSVESATFDKSILALNSGTTVLNGTYTVVKTEGITLSSGSGTLSETPTSNVGVILDSGVIQTVTAVGTSIYVSGGGNAAVTCIYDYSETLVDEIKGYSTNPPTGVELILTSEIRNAGNVKTYDFQITIPNFNVAGNYTLDLSADGVSSQTLEGKALVQTDANGDYYFRSDWIPSATTTISYSDIAATPAQITFSEAAKPSNYQITVLGIRGGVYQNTNLTSSCTYSVTSGCWTITVGSATGLVTAGSDVQVGDYAVVTVDYWDSVSGSLVDTTSAVVNA